jgi:cytochrome c peroxidase
LFRTPSLRNVVLRQTFFHNGLVHSLRDAIAFYVERDTNPGKWYPRDTSGNLFKYDDLPVEYQNNINNEPPFPTDMWLDAEGWPAGAYHRQRDLVLEPYKGVRN